MRFSVSISATVTMLAVGFTSSIAGANDGPFGFSMGATPSVYGCNPLNIAGMYECATAPKPHSSFETYVVQSSAETGICFVKGVGRNVTSNSYGTSIRAETDELAKQISVRYGEPQLFDDLLPGSIWDEPRDWLVSLVKKERRYTYKWESTPEEHVNEIYLAALAIDDDTTYPVAEFYLANYQDCEASTKKGEASSF